jgi:hypothetical protein
MRVFCVSTPHSRVRWRIKFTRAKKTLKGARTSGALSARRHECPTCLGVTDGAL